MCLARTSIPSIFFSSISWSNKYAGIIIVSTEHCKICARTGNYDVSGIVCPFSHLLIACGEIPSKSASFSCDMPFFLLRKAILFPNCFISSMFISFMCRVFYTQQFYYNKISAQKTYSKQQHALTYGLPAVIDLCASLMCILWFVPGFVLYRRICHYGF